MSSHGDRKGFLRGVLDGWRTSVSSSSHPLDNTSRDAESPTGLRSASMEQMETDRIPSPACPNQEFPDVKPGFLHQPTSIAFDPVQRLIALGNRSGFIRILGWGPSGTSSIDCHARHPNAPVAVTQMLFIVNEGNLITMCTDDTIHLWNIKLKTGPEVMQTLKFQKERITYAHLPFQSKWLYIGTERGNVHVANIDSFCLSGYVINWNKIIELSQRNHPGSIVHISDCPIDPNKLLIGFESGQITLWDLRSRTSDMRINHHESLTYLCWAQDGRTVTCSHSDGSITVWEVKPAPGTITKPSSVQYPHAKNITEDLKIEPCKPIFKVEVKSCKNDDTFTIFSGGLPYGSTCLPSFTDTPPTAATPLHHQRSSASLSASSSQDAGESDQPGTSHDSPIASSSSLHQTPHHQPQQSTPSHSPLGAQSLTVIHGKSTTVLEMKGPIYDFLTLCETPYAYDYSEPYAVLVLLPNDLMIVDLTGGGGGAGLEEVEGEDEDADVIMMSKDDGPKYCVNSILPEAEPNIEGSPFVSKEMPEPPKQGFFKGLFSGGPSLLDREELCEYHLHSCLHPLIPTPFKAVLDMLFY